MKKLTKKLLALGLCLTMVFSLGVAQVSADEYMPTEAWRLVDPAADGKIRLFAEPDVNSELLKTFWNETAVIVLEKDDVTGWIKIRIDEYEGYIHSEPKAIEVEEIPEDTTEEIDMITEEIPEVIAEEIEMPAEENILAEEVAFEAEDTIEEVPEIIDNSEKIPEKTDKETLVCTEENEITEEKVLEGITEEESEVIEEEKGISADNISEEITKEETEITNDETETPVEAIPEEKIEEEIDVLTENIFEKIIEEEREVTEEATETPTEEITEEESEATEEATETPTEEITEEESEVTEEATETPTEEIAEEESEVTEEEISEEIVEVNDEDTVVFEGIDEENGKLIENGIETDKEFAGELDETNEVEIIFEAPKAIIWWDAKPVLMPEEPVTLYSQIENPTGYIITYQWQCDKGDGYEDVPDANDETYTFPARVDLLSYYWRLKIDYGVGIIYVE